MPLMPPLEPPCKLLCPRCCGDWDIYTDKCSRRGLLGEQRAHGQTKALTLNTSPVERQPGVQSVQTVQYSCGCLCQFVGPVEGLLACPVHGEAFTLRSFDAPRLKLDRDKTKPGYPPHLRVPMNGVILTPD